MTMKKTLVGVGTAAVLAVVAVGAMGLASAQEPSGDATPSAGRFRERVAQKLGISVEQLDQAIHDAALDTVNDAKAAGTITSEQATRARDRIENGKGLRFFDHIRERREHRNALVRRGIIDVSATALGMTVEELRTELQSGDSIADVATEQGVSLDAVKAQITSDAEAKLAEAVANGRITQEGGDEALAKLTDLLDEILSRSKEPAVAP